MMAAGECIYLGRRYLIKDKFSKLNPKAKYDLEPFNKKPIGQCVNGKDIDQMASELKVILRGKGTGLADTFRHGTKVKTINPGVVYQVKRANDRVDIHGRSHVDFTSVFHLSGRERGEIIYFPILELIATDSQGNDVRNSSFEQALNEVLQEIVSPSPKSGVPIRGPKPEFYLREP